MIVHELKTTQDPMVQPAMAGSLVGNNDVNAYFFFLNQPVVFEKQLCYPAYFLHSVWVGQVRWYYTDYEISIYLNSGSNSVLLVHSKKTNSLLVYKAIINFTEFYIPVLKIKEHPIKLKVTSTLDYYWKNELPRHHFQNTAQTTIEPNNIMAHRNNYQVWKNYLIGLQLTLKNSQSQSINMSLMDMLIKYEVVNLKNHLDFDLKMHYEYRKTDQKGINLPLLMYVERELIIKNNKPLLEPGFFSGISGSKTDYQIQHFTSQVTKNNQDFFVHTTTKTKFDSELGAVVDAETGTEGIVKNFSGKEPAAFYRNINFNGIFFTVRSTEPKYDFNYEIDNLNILDLRYYYEYQVDYTLTDWKAAGNLDLDQGKIFLKKREKKYVKDK